MPNHKKTEKGLKIFFLKSKHALIKFVLFLALIFLLIVLAKIGVLDINNFPVQTGSWYSSIILVGGVVFALLLFFPLSILTVVGATIFHPFYNGVCVSVGAIIAASINFLASKYLGRGFVARFLKKGKLGWLDRQIVKYGFKFVILFRMFSMMPFAVAGYVAGLTKMRFRDYLLATIICVIPGRFFFSYLVSYGISVSISDFLKFLIPLVVIAAIILIIYEKKKHSLHKRIFKKKE